MSTTAAVAGFTRDAFEQFLAGRDEPAWLTAARRGAWEAFERLPMPAGNDEEWRRTDIRLFRFNKFQLPTAAAPRHSCTALLRHGVQTAGAVTTVNSRTCESELADKWRAKGVLFGAMDELLAEHGERLRPFFERAIVPADYDKFAALQAACFSGGSLALVPRGVTLDEPLHIFSVLGDNGVDLSRSLVIVEEGAQATVLAETAGSDGPALHCGAIEIIVGPRAHLRYVNLQNWGVGTWHFAHQRAVVEQGASLQWTIGALGSRLAKVNQHVALDGQGADAQVNGVMFTEGRQHLTYNTLQHHRQPNCHSDLLYKGALQDNSRLVWRGMIKVDPGAQKTDAYQRDDNLMLSESARADSIPGLEIEADDVRCTHGATAGRVDDEQIFYARCRGLTRNEAVRTVVAGFFQQVFDRITIDSVRDALAEAVGRRIREYD